MSRKYNQKRIFKNIILCNTKSVPELIFDPYVQKKPHFGLWLCDVQSTSRQGRLGACWRSHLSLRICCEFKGLVAPQQKLLQLHVKDHQNSSEKKQAKSCCHPSETYKLQANLRLCDLATQRFTNWVTISLSVTTRMTNIKRKGERTPIS